MCSSGGVKPCPDTRPTGRQVVVKVLENEGGRPGSSIHSWRCEYPDRYGPCDCLDVVASEILERLAERGYRPPDGAPVDQPTEETE